MLPTTPYAHCICLPERTQQEYCTTATGSIEPDLKRSIVQIPRTVLLLMGLKTKWNDLSTAGWKDGIWVKVHGCFVIVVLPN